MIYYLSTNYCKYYTRRDKRERVRLLEYKLCRGSVRGKAFGGGGMMVVDGKELKSNKAVYKEKVPRKLPITVP
jgi:hypothetical protein